MSRGAKPSDALSILRESGKSPRPRAPVPTVFRPAWHVSQHGATVVCPGVALGRGQNDRYGHPMARASRVRRERDAAGLAVGAALGSYGVAGRGPPYVVTITRVAPSAGLDDDNLAGACKAWRDGVADALGTGDGPKSPVKWRYLQRRGPWAVEVSIAWGQGGET